MAFGTKVIAPGLERQSEGLDTGQRTGQDLLLDWISTREMGPFG